MEKKLVLLVLAMLLVLSFGCIGGQQSSNQQGGQQQGAGEQQNQEQQQNQAQEQNQENLAVKISDAIGGSIPYECTIKSKDGNINIKSYIKGKNIRSISTQVKDGKTIQAEVLTTSDGYMYAKLLQPYNNCEWLKFKIEQSASQGMKETPEESLRNYEKNSSIEYNCVVGNFGDEMFTPPANACTQQDLAKVPAH